MPDDDDWGENPGKPENRGWPGGKSGDSEVLREDHARERIEKRERGEPPERPPDRDED